MLASQVQRPVVRWEMRERRLSATGCCTVPRCRHRPGERSGQTRHGEDMLRHAIPIGRTLGIPIDLDYSWFLVFGLLTWVLAVSYYPSEFKHWGTAEYWLMGAGTAVMLFVSVLLHELGHSVVARQYGIAVPRITLFVFGGVSELATDPCNPRVEFWIATAGQILVLRWRSSFGNCSPSLFMPNTCWHWPSIWRF